VKARKLYFLDNGLANISARLSSGAAFENAVFNQLIHFGELSYYQLKNGNEIDFILDKKHGFEIKETGNKNDYDKLIHLASNIKVEKGNVLCRYQPNEHEGLVWGGMIR
jgi:predicted AAA+ superfamily ATPase